MLVTRWIAVGKRAALSDEMSQGLQWLVEHFRSAKPRVVSGASLLPPIVIFTDGACEEAGTTIGGVIYEQHRQPECFGAKLQERTIAKWRTRLNQEQVIGQAELFPLLVARLTWSDRLRNRRVLFFIDNEAARIGLVRSYSPVLPSLQLIMSCLGWDSRNGCQGWYARVCSYSNIADGPSRLQVPSQASGIKVVAPVFPVGDIPDVVL